MRHLQLGELLRLQLCRQQTSVRTGHGHRVARQDADQHGGSLGLEGPMPCRMHGKSLFEGRHALGQKTAGVFLSDDQTNRPWTGLEQGGK